ncbi:Putative binding protein precursor [Polystyrenella longa]|uniref:Binding protein n=1 Tax=Polystyrenella longa TaxID=2528007 RepID=A0A518CMM3_9PLAN|nr:molybdate ABC transporter substrate-binding protein [Polystyrenella longa]QDU80453.1 Putative binding protein precursor [Polystyrenella longa]
MIILEKKLTERNGKIDSLFLLVGGALLVIAVLSWSLYSLDKTDSTSEGKNLVMFCAAGIRPVTEDVAKQYMEEYGVEVQLQYGGSNTLLSQIEASQTGDLFLSADEVYMTQGQAKGLIQETLPLATMKPVLLVAGGNPKGILSADDLVSKDLIIAIGNPGQAAVGRKTEKLLTDSGHWKKLEAKIRNKGVMKATVPEVANDVKIGSADVGIVWDTTALNYPDLEVIELPELDAGKAQVKIGVLTSASNPTAALKFARYIAARDRGLESFTEHGFNAIPDGDIWAEHPELNFYCGSVNRRAVEEAIKQFEAREGVTVNTRYDGCGILVGQMRTILDQDQGAGFPDTYMACDRYYLEQVNDLFQEDVNISSTDVVIAVPKGNPKKIESLHDLTREGMRVAVGQPEQCTIGVLTKQIFDAQSLTEEIQPNIATQTTSSAQLVPLVLTNSVDAVLAYLTDTKAEQDNLDVIPIKTDESKAIQPFSIAKSSEKKYLSRRLYEKVAHSQQAFETAGFTWLLEPEPAEQ